MERLVTLKNGRQVVIRPMRPDDVDRSATFFAELAEEERRYLRTDVTRRELVERRVEDMLTHRVGRLVAVDGDRIVADGGLELVGHGWGDGIAEIRLIIADSHQRVGLGTLMARELYLLAAQHRVDRIVVRMMAPQTGARAIFHRLGFDEEFVIPSQIRDQAGVWQDLIIMRCNLEDTWRELEAIVEHRDVRRDLEHY